MATKKKMLQAAAGNAGGAGLNVEEVFSTYLYEGTGSAITITNGIDLADEGGLVWAKVRDRDSRSHILCDTERGVNRKLSSNETAAELFINSSFFVTQFNSDGYIVGGGADDNESGQKYASWTFRKAPKFFDVVTYTGNGVAGRTIPHNLGCNVGAIFIKRTNVEDNWPCFHRSLGGSKVIQLNVTDQAYTVPAYWNSTSPTDSVFTLGSDNATNNPGDTYVAYIFAHNNGDGEFGPDADQDIIKCGSVPASAETTEDLGWEPQWLLIKRTDSTGDWQLFDNMRGLFVGGPDNARLRPNLSNAEDGSNSTFLQPRSTGFYINTNYFGGGPYIYIAIRRGPLAPPESATEVFDVDTAGSTAPSPPQWTSGFVTDFALHRTVNTANSTRAVSRLTGEGELFTNLTNAEGTDVDLHWDYMNGFWDGSTVNANQYAWMWKRAPNFFDVVAYTGDGVAGRTVSHNLGVAPEMIWAKQRSSSGNSWRVWYEGVPSGKMLRLNGSDGVYNETSRISDADATTFTLNDGTSGINGSGSTYIAYLFASLDGVSKVGSYTGTGQAGGNINVDCGFTSGARFVMIKRTDASGTWWVADTERGIVTGNDPLLALNDTSAELTGYNMVEPSASGFIVNGSGVGGDNSWNDAGGNYIFYAIA